jgi:hypothetical protein
MSFVLLPSPYEQIPALLKAAVPGFAQSDEYQLHGEADDLPGVVLASFANFLARQSREAPADEALDKGLAVASDLWRSNDSRTLEAMRDEFFAALASDPDAIAVIVPRMEPVLRDGYAAWTASK